MLPAATQAEILRLAYAEHWSLTRIAHHVGVNWKSVRKVVQRRSVALDRARPRPRTTLLTPFLAQLQTLLARDPERSAVNCLQHLRAAGYRGGITTLRMALARLRPAPASEAFVALTFGPGERVQIDWGEFGDVFGIGRAVHAFLLVCCYSRLLTVEFTFSQTLEAFLRCHEHAFAFLGGYSREAQYDNLATAVAERRGRLVRWNPRFLAYAGHCGFRPVACTPGRGNEKGRVEDSVKYLRANFWPGRTFRDLADLNAQAQAWRDTVANQREHRATRKIPGLHVAEERPHWLPLREPYDTDEVRTVVVPPSFRVAFDRNRYSVPWRLVGKAAHAPGRCRDGDPVVRDAPGGAARPRLGARPRTRAPRPCRRAPRAEAGGAGPVAGPGRRAARPIRAALPRADPRRHPVAPGGTGAPAAPHHALWPCAGRGGPRGVPGPGDRGERARGAVAQLQTRGAARPAPAYAGRSAAHGAAGTAQPHPLRCLARGPRPARRSPGGSRWPC